MLLLSHKRPQTPIRCEYSMHHIARRHEGDKSEKRLGGKQRIVETERNSKGGDIVEAWREMEDGGDESKDREEGWVSSVR